MATATKAEATKMDRLPVKYPEVNDGFLDESRVFGDAPTPIDCMIDQTT
jgi:hypothetical protein